MKKIWLVCHSQSQSQSAEDNDVVDPELSELGRRQAGRLVKTPAKLGIGSNFSQPSQAGLADLSAIRD